MNYRLFIRLSSLFGLSGTVLSSLTGAVLDFESFPLDPSGYFQGAPAPGGDFGVDGFSLTNTFTDWGGGFTSWSGFGVSSLQTSAIAPGDITAGSLFGYQNESAPGGASEGSQFGMAYLSAPGDAVIALPNGSDKPVSIDLTNNLYAYASMVHGDPFAKQFGGPDGTDPDYFLLTITGLDGADTVLGSVDVYLADFRSSNSAEDFILDQWITVDLSALGSGAVALDFALSSTDNGDFGMNTPANFAFDNLVAVPEVASFAWILGGLGLGLVWFRRL